MTLHPLPLSLRILQTLEFPFKLGVCERLFGHRLRDGGIQWVQTAAGLPWKLDLANPTHRWIVYGKYEGAPFLQWAERNLPRDGIIVDSGANIGQMLLYLAQWVPRGRVLAFEPGSAAAEWLNECLRRNTSLPVRIYRQALGEKPGHLHLKSLGPETVHGAWNQISSSEGQEIEVVRLDDVLSGESLDHVDLWKLDVEGSEILAMKGAEPWLQQQRIRALYVELTGENGRQIINYLSRWNYQGFLFNRWGKLCPLLHWPEHANGLFLPAAGKGA